MTIQLTATEAKARLLALLDRAAAGEEIEITKHGRPVARIVPPAGAAALKGSFSGVVKTASDDDEAVFGTGLDWNAS